MRLREHGRLSVFALTLASVKRQFAVCAAERRAKIMAKIVDVWADGSGVWHATVSGAGAGDAAGRRVARAAIVNEIAQRDCKTGETHRDAAKRVSAAVRIGRDFSVGGFSAVGWSEVAR